LDFLHHATQAKLILSLQIFERKDIFGERNKIEASFNGRMDQAVNEFTIKTLMIPL
jgi:hypothetical protein